MVARADDPEQWPFLQYSVPVLSYHVEAVIPGLVANTRYILMARAHKRGEVTGWYKKWSKVAHYDGICATPAAVASVEAFGSADKEEIPLPATRPRTRWVEIFRINGISSFAVGPPDPMNNYTLPDYIENHNAFTTPPSDASVASYWPAKNSSITRYCAEFADVTFDNVTTPGYTYGGTGGEVHNVTSHYADYLSCNGGKCDCMLCGDRVVFLGHKAMKQVCPMTAEEEKWVDEHYQPNATSVPEKQAEECHYKVTTLPPRRCNCPNLALSLKHVGMAQGMLSFPLGGQCPFGAYVGEGGCTWRTDPLSFSISMGGLVEKGGLDPKKTPQENVAVALAAYKEFGARSCGSNEILPKVSKSPLIAV
jgi:hypothetical protein